MPRIYLIGARASGKTTIGRSLARRLAFPFYDLDECLCAHAGESIADIVSERGWMEFRRLESEILQKTGLSRENMVVATGGGIVLAKINRDYMRAHGHVIWLNPPAEHMAARLAADPLTAQRPSLTGKGLLDEIGEVLKERQPFYAACAHFIIHGSPDVQEACTKICEAIGGMKAQ